MFILRVSTSITFLIRTKSEDVYLIFIHFNRDKYMFCIKFD